jgi:pyruvate/2-oxoglutarate/acetoin dehydrogenase E1 component
LEDPRVRLLGEAVELSPATRGLAASHPEQVRSLPAADATLVGVALGMAMNGDKVVVELAGPDSLPAALQQLKQAEPSPDSPLTVVLRIPVSPLQFSDAGVVMQAGSTEFHIAAVGQAGDAAGLLQGALQQTVPTVLFEPLEVLSGPVSAVEDVAFQAPRLLAQGDHATVLAWGVGVEPAVRAAAVLAAEGIAVDVIDLRTLGLYDHAVVSDRVQHTGRPIIATVPGYQQVLAHVVTSAFLRLESPPEVTAADPGAIVDVVRSSVHF